MGEYVGRIYDEVTRAAEVHRRVAPTGWDDRASKASASAYGPTARRVSAAAGLHPGRRAGHAAGRARARHAQAAAARSPASRSCCTSCGCWRAHGATRVVLCVGYLRRADRGARSAPSASASSSRYSLRRARSWTERSGAIRRGAATARRAVPGALRRHLPAHRLRARSTRALARERPAGADDRAAQRGPLGHLERASTRDGRVHRATTSARRRRRCAGSTTASAG